MDAETKMPEAAAAPSADITASHEFVEYVPEDGPAGLTFSVIVLPGDDPEDGTEWSMEFRVRDAAGKVRLTYLTIEPSEYTERQWVDLADGKGDLPLYPGSAEKCIACVGFDYQFDTVQSHNGAGGILTACVARSVLAPLIRAAIAEAISMGLTFAPQN